MTGVFILFIVSLVGIIVLMLIKVRELEHGNIPYPMTVRKGFDSYMEGTIDKIHNTSQQLNHISFGIILARIMRVVTLSARLIYKTAIQSENKILNLIKGKRTLERTTRRSDFLGSIEEHKRDNGGEIGGRYDS